MACGRPVPPFLTEHQKREFAEASSQLFSEQITSEPTNYPEARFHFLVWQFSRSALAFPHVSRACAATSP